MYIYVESRLNNCLGQSEVRVAKVSDMVHESLVIFAFRLFSNGRLNATHLYSVYKKNRMIKNNPSVLIRSFVFKKKIVTLLWPTMQCHLSFFLYRIHWIICGLHWLPVDFQKAYQCKISVRCCHNPSYCMT